MPSSLKFAFPLILAPAVSLADSVRLEVIVQDMAETDWIVVRNTEGCGPVSGSLTLDFTASEGQVVIDTEVGGSGTLYPAVPAVVAGPARVMPVADGDRRIHILMAGLEADDQIAVSLDMDSGAAPGRVPSIVATWSDLEGSLAVFTKDGEEVATIFADTGRVMLDVPGDCAPIDLSGVALWLPVGAA